MVEAPKQFPDFQCLHTVQLLSFYSPFHTNKKEGKDRFCQSDSFQIRHPLALVSGMYPAVHGGSLALFVLHSIGVQHLGIRHHQGQ